MRKEKYEIYKNKLLYYTIRRIHNARKNKRVKLSIIALMVLFCMMPVVPSHAEMRRAQNTKRVMVSLEITDGIATCKGSIKAEKEGSTISSSLVLMQMNGAKTKNIKTWYASSKTKNLDVINTIKVTKGNYKLLFSATITYNGKIETTSKTAYATY